MAKIFFIGDSITTGAWDDQGGWANRLISQIMAKAMDDLENPNAFYCLPYNLGVSGDTIADILPRFKKEVAARCDTDNKSEKIQIVFAVGINDSTYLVKENKPRFSDKKFQNNLDKLIKKAKKITNNISFIGLLPVDDALLDPIPWAIEKAYANRYVEKFEAMIENRCQTNDIPFLPMYERWLNMPDYKDHLIDGVHPNTKGHALMAQEIGDFLFTKEFYQFHS